MMDLHVARSLCAAAAAFLGQPVEPRRWLRGGDESRVLKVRAAGTDLVAIATSSRLSNDEIAWAHAVARHAHESVPEVVIPIVRNGQSTVRWGNGCVAVYPFVAAKLAKRTSPRHRIAAAGLLARLHRALLGWKGGQRPASKSATPPPPLPPAMADMELAIWWREQQSSALSSAIHGDYYQRNLLCLGEAIVGVIDWHDAQVGPLAVEVAGATFEFCRDSGNRLDTGAAQLFIDAYRASGGPVPNAEIAVLSNFMRVWLQRDVALNLLCGAQPGDPYIQRQVAAFRRLVDEAWVPR